MPEKDEVTLDRSTLESIISNAVEKLTGRAVKSISYTTGEENCRGLNLEICDQTVEQVIIKLN